MKKEEKIFPDGLVPLIAKEYGRSTTRVRQILLSGVMTNEFKNAAKIALDMYKEERIAEVNTITQLINDSRCPRRLSQAA